MADLHVVTVQFPPSPMSLSPPPPILSVLLQLILHSGSPSPPGRLAGSWYLVASRSGNTGQEGSYCFWGQHCWDTASGMA